MSFKDLIAIFKQTISEYGEDKVARLAAALAYYTVFSLAPMLVIIIAVAGFFFGAEAARGQIVDQISGLIGPDAAGMVQTMIQGASNPTGGIIATVVGVVTLLVGATGAFGQLQAALNQAWDVPDQATGQGILDTLKDRLLSFTMVLGVAFLLLVSLVLSAGISALSTFITGLAPGMETLFQAVNIVLSFVIITGLFAAIYKVLPDADIEWRDVWVGAAFTSLLFTIGKYLLGLYLGNSGAASSFGAAGSLVLILLWIYYSAQILLFGAEFTQVYSERHGSRIAVAGGADQSGTPGLIYQPEPLLDTMEIEAMQPRGATPALTGVILTTALAVIGFVINAARRDAQRY